MGKRRGGPSVKSLFINNVEFLHVSRRAPLLPVTTKIIGETKRNFILLLVFAFFLFGIFICMIAWFFVFEVDLISRFSLAHPYV